MFTTDLIKGTLKTLVMKLLHSRGKMYGYEITQQVKLLTADKVVITEGALYPLLHKLEAEGWLVTETNFVGKRIRKYYKLSAKGIERSVEMQAEFKDYIITMQKFISEA